MNDAVTDGLANAAALPAATLHATTLALDSHIDIPWPHDQNPFGKTDRHVDFPKMLAGGMNAGCFVAYLPQGPRTKAGGDEAAERCFAMLRTINAYGDTQNGITARVCASADAISQAFADGVLAVVPAIENGHAIGDDLSRIAQFRDLGVTYITISHNGHNMLADSANPRRDLGDSESLHGGLSPLGRDAITEMNRVGILVDVSHLSRASMLQAVAHSATPVVATHSCAAALCSHARNLDDSQLDALRASGGVVQVTAMPPFLRYKGRMDAVKVADLVDHIDYIVRRIGITHCGISSDFDGGGAITGWRNAAETCNVTTELVTRGYTAADIAALWGGNFLRAMRGAQG